MRLNILEDCLNCVFFLHIFRCVLVVFFFNKEGRRKYELANPILYFSMSVIQNIYYSNRTIYLFVDLDKERKREVRLVNKNNI